MEKKASKTDWRGKANIDNDREKAMMEIDQAARRAKKRSASLFFRDL